MTFRALLYLYVFGLLCVVLQIQVRAAGGDETANDTFTEAVDTLLQNHTSDSSHSWTEVFDSEGDDNLEILAASDDVRPENDSSDLSAGAALLIGATPTSADYQVQFVCEDCGNGDDYVTGIIRSTDTFDENNGAYVAWDLDPSNLNDANIRKITGTATCDTVDTYDESSLAAWADNSTIIIQAHGSEIVVLDDNIGFLNGTDASITAAGKGGVGMGAAPCDTAGDFSGGAQEVDNFKIIEIANGSEGYSNPTTTGETDNNWTDATNAYSSNDSDATEDTLGAAGDQDYGDFGFTRTNCTAVRGIQVKAEWDDASAFNLWTELGIEVSNDNGTSWSSQLVARLGPQAGDDTIVFGHANYLWGLTWTCGDLADTDFRVRGTYTAEQGTTATLSVDHISVKVFYDTAVASSPIQPRDDSSIIWFF